MTGAAAGDYIAVARFDGWVTGLVEVPYIDLETPTGFLASEQDMSPSVAEYHGEELGWLGLDFSRVTATLQPSIETFANVGEDGLIHEWSRTVR